MACCVHFLVLHVCDVVHFLKHGILQRNVLHSNGATVYTAIKRRLLPHASKNMKNFKKYIFIAERFTIDTNYLAITCSILGYCAVSTRPRQHQNHRKSAVKTLKADCEWICLQKSPIFLQRIVYCRAINFSKQ